MLLQTTEGIYKTHMDIISRFQHGQTVWVKSLEDILMTLDADGKVNGLPFMHEMARYCGLSFKVSSIPIKTCVEGGAEKFHSVTGMVFLENLRCDGVSHDGCQRGCTLFWNIAWISEHPLPKTAYLQSGPITSQVENLKTMNRERYFCQSTELAGATSDFHENTFGPQGKLSQSLRDIRFGKMTVFAFLRMLAKTILNRLKVLFGMNPSYIVRGRKLKTDTEVLNLQPGEWVEVKSRREIEETLDVTGKNRGLLFDSPMLDSCGKRYRVANRITKIILENTGQMVNLKNTVVLENVVCRAYNCHRANLQYWREIWLKRV